MELIKRILISVIFIPVLLWIYYIGGIVLSSFLAIICVASAFELQKMLEKKDIKLLSLNIVFCLSLFFSIIYNSPYSYAILFLAMVFNSMRDVFLSKIEGTTARLSSSLLLICYPAIGFGMLYKISETGSFLVPLIAVMIWLTDSFAYFIGMSLGKHRGIFKCSPKKSVEGFIAGILTAFLGSLIAYKLFDDVNSMQMVFILTISTGIFGQFGDLFESIIKRDIGVKDSSGLIPGHGGVLDRFDSLLIAAPVFYILLKILN